LGDDPAAWREHLIEGLCRLLRADVGIAGELCFNQSGLPPVIAAGTMDRGWASESQRRVFLQYMRADGQLRDPTYPATSRLMTRSGTICRRDAVGDRRWYSCDHYNLVRRVAGVDDFLHSGYLIGSAGISHHIHLARQTGSRPFTVGQLRLLHLFHEELGRLWDEPAASVRPDAAAGLPPRQRQVLSLLHEGESEKQIALALGLSRHTVHDHIRALHARFQVNSRAELLSRSLPRPRFLPCLSTPSAPQRLRPADAKRTP
jgi:DNA-binding CsgD family transcriptional regulator